MRVSVLSIVYDGDCPLCRRLATRARLEGRVDRLELVDARRSPLSDVQGVDCRRIDLNRGFAVIVDGRLFEAAEGARVLATLAAAPGPGSALLTWLFLGRRRGRVAYALARAGRSMLLRMLRIPKLPPPE